MTKTAIAEPQDAWWCCGRCRVKFVDGQRIVQVRVGYYDEPNDFCPDYDLEYYCSGCYEEKA